MSDAFRSYNTFENLTGICSGATGQGIFINLPTQTILSNSFGYNISPTGSTSANGILAKGYGSSNINLIKLNNCEGKSFAGNGISVTNGVLNNCTGTSADGNFAATYYSFIGTATTIFNNCESRVGSGDSYPLQLKSLSGDAGFGYVNASKINNCSFKSPNAYCIVVSSSIYESIEISNSTIFADISEDGYTPISLPTGCSTPINIDNCSISGYYGPQVGYGSSINNNSITVFGSFTFWLAGTTSSPSIVEYSNNIISGSPIDNSGVDTVISQGIPINTNVDNYGNIIYHQRVYPGLVGYWDLGNPSSYAGTGNALNDISYPGVSDTLITNATYSSSNGGFLNFDGAGDYAVGVGAAGPTAYNPLVITSSITIEAFINVTNFASNGNICNRSSNQGYRLRITDTGKINFLANSDGTFINYETSATVPTNTWIHVVATHGPTGGVIYRNTNVGATSGIAFGANTDATQGFYIGSITGLGEFFNGKIGLLRIYNRVLSVEEVRQNWLADRKRFGL